MTFHEKKMPENSSSWGLIDCTSCPGSNPFIVLHAFYGYKSFNGHKFYSSTSLHCPALTSLVCDWIAQGFSRTAKVTKLIFFLSSGKMYMRSCLWYLTWFLFLREGKINLQLCTCLTSVQKPYKAFLAQVWSLILGIDFQCQDLEEYCLWWNF